MDLVTLDDLSAAAMLESSARIESLANAWEHIGADNHPHYLATGPMPSYRRHTGFCGQLVALTVRYILYKQPSSMLAWISKLVCAAVLSLIVGCIFWDIPASDPQLDLHDRLGYIHILFSMNIYFNNNLHFMLQLPPQHNGNNVVAVDPANTQRRVCRSEICRT